MTVRISMLFAALLLSLLLVATASSPAARAQNGLQPTDDHPEKAVCTVCAGRSTHGSAPEAEAVEGVSTHDGKHYYFCSDECKQEFDASPDWWVPLELPFPVPALEVRSLEGDVVPLSVGGGELTLLDFWATWCQPCKKTMRDLQERFEQEEDGLRIVGVSIDEGEKALDEVRRFVRKHGARYPIVLDDALARQESPAWTALKVRAVPTMMLIDREGRVVWRYTGPDGDDLLDEVLERFATPGP